MSREEEPITQTGAPDPEPARGAPTGPPITEPADYPPAAPPITGPASGAPAGPPITGPASGSDGGPPITGPARSTPVRSPVAGDDRTLTQTGSGQDNLRPSEPAGASAQKPLSADAPRGSVEIPPSLHARFEDFRVVGRGGMGVVFRARDLRLNRVVAIKLLFREGSGGGLLREARAQAKLRHPHVCEVFEAGVAEHVPFIVMRYIEGGPLQNLRADMSLEEKVAAVRDVALALHEAHRTGLIHRDVKPGNILVERADEGGYRPYICDFGIARDVTDTGVTMAGAIHGTPAYMAPEQAAGKARSLDRRTDVYGLGATLYDTIAGNPPITAPSIIDMLKAVIEVEPAPLTKATPGIPADLDAIVMKCLEKAPAGRYESAKALAEDLQRFLDGDPVRARPTSWGARLWKRARKHRGKVAVGAAALAAGLTLAGLWVRDRRAADHRAVFAREMGGAVREMELFLREAHTLPLHDIERESDVVRARLRDVEAKMAAAGDIGLGPGHDALGRGYLALQDPKSALQHFDAARAAGEDAPGLDYAMGLAHIELYREALAKASRIQKASDKEAYLAAIAKEHKEPALAHLRAALTRGVESPAFAHGVIALAEGRHEEALARAEEAYQAAPWLYEAKKLEGDVLAAMGEQTGPDKVFDAARTSGLYERAAKAYAEASDIARSDPAVHEAECQLWVQAMNTATESGASMRPGFEKAKSACDRAIAASPGRASSRTTLAFAHQCFAYWVGGGRPADVASPEQVLSEATDRVDEAVKTSPGDVFATYLSGAVWRARALYSLDSGRDAGPAIDRSVAAYEATLALDPRFLWALNEECTTLWMRGTREARRGIDPTATFQKALGLCTRAIEGDKDFMYPRGSLALVHVGDAERLKDAGASPARAVEEGLSAIAAAEKADPSWRWAPYHRATLHRIEAEYAVVKGDDPGPALARAEAAVAHLAGHQSSFSDADAVEGEVATVTAEARLSRMAPHAAPDADLESALARARKAFGRALAEVPWNIEVSVWLSRVELSELRYQRAIGKATDEHVRAVLAPLAQFLNDPRDDPRLYAAAARAHEAAAEMATAAHREAESEITACVDLAEKAAATGPGLATGHAVLGDCRLMRARAESDAGKKKDAARLAVQAFEGAARANPLLATALSASLEEARRLSESR